MQQRSGPCMKLNHVQLPYCWLGHSHNHVVCVIHMWTQEAEHFHPAHRGTWENKPCSFKPALVKIPTILLQIPAVFRNEIFKVQEFYSTRGGEMKEKCIHIPTYCSRAYPAFCNKVSTKMPHNLSLVSRLISVVVKSKLKTTGGLFGDQMWKLHTFERHTVLA